MSALGEQLLIKLWETIADKGIGSLLKPWQKGREGRVEIELKRQELLTLAQTEVDANLIRIGKKKLLSDGSVVEVDSVAFDDKPPSLPYIASMAGQNVLADAIRKEVNLSKIVVYAEDELINDPQRPSETTVSDDWLFRWKEFASRVSDDQIQHLWAKILAGEIKNPGSSSYRMIDFIDKLNRDEISDISKVFSLTMTNNNLIVRGAGADIDFLAGNGLTKDFFEKIGELGIISQTTVGAVNVATSLDLAKFNPFQLAYNGFVVSLKNTDKIKDGKISIIYYMLTKLGRELFFMARTPANRSYLESLVNDFSKAGVISELCVL
jgi:hypothetical protein